MIINTIKIKVHPDKSKEFSQTILAIINSIRKEKGCLSYNFYQDLADENNLLLIGEWDVQEDLVNHLRSNTFSVLRGAMNLLSTPPEIKFNVVSYKAGTEALKAARGEL